MSNEYSIKFRRQYNLEIEPDEVFQKFNEKFQNDPKSFLGRIVKPNIFLKVGESERHYWSPEMNMNVEKEDDKTHIREVIGPNPAVFTLTMFLIFFAGTLFLFTLMYLFSQLTLDMDTSLTWIVIGICFVLFVVISLFMFYGRVRAKPQMEMMRGYIEEIINS